MTFCLSRLPHNVAQDGILQDASPSNHQDRERQRSSESLSKQEMINIMDEVLALLDEDDSIGVLCDSTSKPEDNNGDTHPLE